ncbi:MAG: DEAD/DEAH box helicase [Thermoleophilia bacterium]
MTDFESFGLSGPVLEAINKMGFVEATPIQKKAIPLIMEGRDLLGQAQTGTGKTAAFGIPIAQTLSADSPAVQALILSPTRELAVQIAEEVHEITLFSGHKVLPIYGGQRIDRQITALKKGVQVVVGTPGRILDHLGRGTLSLSEIKLLVLDEADMMLDMGFIPDIRRILRQCPKERQTLLFSATIPSDIERIAREYMKNPEKVSVVPETMTLEETEQIFYEVPEDEKIDALMRLLDFEEEGASAIIFCRTKRNVDRLARKLKARGYDVEGLHGDLTQAQRDQIMQGFRDQRFSYLVATDVASRGLDISHVTHVINFHVPQDPESYIHRIGRTGRMGRSGVAITFVTPAEYWDLLRIQEFSMATIEEGELPTTVEVAERRRAARGDTKARRRVEEVDRSVGRPVRHLEEEATAALEAGVGVSAPEVVEAQPAEKRRRGRRQPAEASLSGLLGQTEEPTTEAERVQRRYALRDARKRIGWVDAGEALKEASRIEHEERVGVAHSEAHEGADATTEGGVAADEASVRSAAEEARRVDVLARLQEAQAAIQADREVRLKAGFPEAEPVIPAEMPAVLPQVVPPPTTGEVPLLLPEEEVRLRRAMGLRERVSRLVDGLDLSDLADFEAILSRLEHDHDLRQITAALIKALAGSEAATDERLGATVPASAAEGVEEAAPAEAGDGQGRVDAGDEMTRLFISIGRRAHVNRDGLERLVREAAQLEEDDIGRIDLLHNFAFIEVRKAVAGRVIEGMHETMFKGREISVEPAKSGGKDD